jgi:hypothetical protein
MPMGYVDKDTLRVGGADMLLAWRLRVVLSRCEPS